MNVLAVGPSVLPPPAGEGTLVDGVGVGLAEELGEPLGAAGVGVSEGTAGWLAPPLGVAGTGAASVDAAADGPGGRPAGLVTWTRPGAGAATAEPPGPGVPWPGCRARRPCRRALPGGAGAAERGPARRPGSRDQQRPAEQPRRADGGERQRRPGGQAGQRVPALGRERPGSHRPGRGLIRRGLAKGGLPGREQAGRERAGRSPGDGAADTAGGRPGGQPGRPVQGLCPSRRPGPGGRRDRAGAGKQAARRPGRSGQRRGPGHGRAQVVGPEGHVPGGDRAVPRVLAGQLGDQGRYPGRDGRRQGWQRLFHVRDDHGQRRAAERNLPGQALMGHDAQRVEVGRGGRGLTRAPLGGQVTGGADQHPGTGDRLRPGRLRDAEIGDLDHAIGADQQVARLDVPVDQPGPVRGGQPAGGLGDDVHRPRRIERAVVQHPGQREPGHELHHQVPGPAGPDSQKS